MALPPWLVNSEDNRSAMAYLVPDRHPADSWNEFLYLSMVWTKFNGREVWQGGGNTNGDTQRCVTSRPPVSNGKSEAKRTAPFQMATWPRGDSWKAIRSHAEFLSTQLNALRP